ncbi:hypothetical protein C0Z16_20010 [Paraburkholderia rhynchosiae]|uniref:Uncharacterized protein n=1 Tax=Paraburkholderia rhynchosiae TaxID=487049 RepID=A0ABX4V1N6_9BURK|nr:hypothetical protein C0Z16_20010 [Paraburkholderia rhynchosiae]
MFRSSRFSVQGTGRLFTVHLLNAADARSVDQGFVISETGYFEASEPQRIARGWKADGTVRLVP